MSDELDALSDAALNEVFTIEVAGWVKRTEGLVWDKEEHRAFILPGSHLESVRRKMGLSMDNVLVNFVADARAVLPWLEKEMEVSNVFEHGKWFVGIEQKPARPGTFAYGTAPTFARAACLALIRANHANHANP